MNLQALLVELIFAGFFAVACIRASAPAVSDVALTFGDFFRLPGRRERLRRSRWQWVAAVLLLLAVRLQQGMPVVLEVTVILQFLVFLALPTRATAPRPLVGRRELSERAGH